jgi:hypothetical protein
MTVWRHSEAVEEDVPELPGIDLQNKRRRSRRAWGDGLADQTVVRHLENVRSYRAFERALMATVDLRSVLELALVHRLASLLWRLRRASAIETGLFEMQGEALSARRPDPSRGPGQPATLQTPAQANGHKIASGSNGRDQPPASTKNCCRRPCARHLHHGRSPAPSPNISCVFPNLIRTCLTAWVATKPDSGVKPRKPSGLSRL